MFHGCGPGTERICFFRGIVLLLVVRFLPTSGHAMSLVLTIEACYDRASWTIIFFPSILSLLYHGPTYLFAPCNSLELDLPSDTKARTRCLVDCVLSPPPYLLHALPSLLLYYLCMHQYLLMCTLHAPPMPIPPHCCLMYHCTICAHYRTPLHV